MKNECLVETVQEGRQWQLMHWQSSDQWRTWGRTMAKAVAGQGAWEEEEALTSAERARPDTERTWAIGRWWGPSSAPVPRISVGKRTFQEAMWNYRLYHYFPQIYYLFPLLGLLALKFLTLWWVNFVLIFINALSTFPWVQFWLVIRFSVWAIVRHCLVKRAWGKWILFLWGTVITFKKFKLCFST